MAAALLLAACLAPAPASPAPAPTASPFTWAGRITPAASQPAAPGVTASAPTETVSGSLYLPSIANANAATATATTAPTEAPAQPPAPPEPTPEWPAPLSGTPASKLGLHVLGTSDPYVMEFIRRYRPRVVKSVGDVGWLSEVKAVSPGTLTIGRLMVQEDSWMGSTDPGAAAQAYVEQNLAQYQLNPGVDYWEGWNETVPVTPERWTWFAQFEAARACLMQAHGLRAAVGGFAYGNPEYAQMALFLPALEAAHRCGGMFTLHEGVPPALNQCPILQQNTAGIIPEAPAFNVPMSPRALRYRFWYEGYLKPRGLGDLPLVISELAIAPDCGIPLGDAWTDYEGWWVDHGVGPDGPRSYVNLLAWYDSNIQQDPYVVGAAIFTAGANNPGSPWYLWDLHRIFLPLAGYFTGAP